MDHQSRNHATSERNITQAVPETGKISSVNNHHIASLEVAKMVRSEMIINCQIRN